MTKQIAVRLPENVIDFLDRAVSEGIAPSRAALVSAALEREMRRLAGVRDAQILRSLGATDDLDDLVSWTVGNVSVEN